MNKNLLRYPTLDYLRGFYVLLMIIFHYCFVLSDYNILDFDFYRDPFWLHSRTFIVTGFLTIVGISLVLANRNGFNQRTFLRRLGLLVGYASLVSIATHIEAGSRWVYFGILHFIAVASVLGLLMTKFKWLSFVLGLMVIGLGLTVEHSFFDPKWINWFGLMTHKPKTEDYVPVIPWLGVVLLGVAIGRQIVENKTTNTLNALLSWQSSSPLIRSLEFLGKYAIHIYIIHVPLFIGIIEAILWI